jgi:hypothetical protein
LVDDSVEINNFVDNRGTLDISDTNIYMGFTSSSSFSSGSFNGWVLTDVFNTIDAFISVSINAMTTLAGLDMSRISVLEDSISVNFANLSFSEGDIVSLDITASQVPEPGTLLLIGSGLAGLALYRRRMMKN